MSYLALKQRRWPKDYSKTHSKLTNWPNNFASYAAQPLAELAKVETVDAKDFPEQIQSHHFSFYAAQPFAGKGSVSCTQLLAVARRWYTCSFATAYYLGGLLSCSDVAHQGDNLLCSMHCKLQILSMHLNCKL